MRLEFNNFKAKVDVNKLVVDFKHEFKPFDDKDIVVVCNYLANGEVAKYASESIGDFDYRKLFLDKVEEIRGLTLAFNGEDVEATPEMLCQIPFGMTESQRFVSTLIQRVAMHILTGDQLSEDEVKNSD